MTTVTGFRDVIQSGEGHYEITPKYRPPSPMPGIMFCHGYGDDASYPIVPTARQSHLTNLLVEGTRATGISQDLGGTGTWGNATAQSRMTATYNRLQTRPDVAAGKVWLLSASMGAMASLVWAAANPTKVAGIISIIPVINPTDIVTNNRSGYAAAVNAAFSGGWSEATYGAVYNPQTLASAGKFAGIPMLLWYGTTDALCVPAEVTAFAAKPGMSVTTIALAGGHALATYDLVDHPTALAFMRAHP